MPEPQDPLKSVFKQAAAAGQAGARAVPVSVIAERGDRRRRRHLAALAAVLCVAFAGTGAAVATLLPGNEGTIVPAGTPSDVPASSPGFSPTMMPTGPPPSGTASSTVSRPPSDTPSGSVGGTPSDTPSDSPTYPPSGTATTDFPSNSAPPGP